MDQKKTAIRGDVLRVRRLVEARPEHAALYAALYAAVWGSYDDPSDAIRAASHAFLVHLHALEKLTTEDPR